MEVKSSYYIDRHTAISIIVAKIHQCTNDELENILEGFKESEYRNYMVYPSVDFDEEPSITSLEEFNDMDL